MPPQAVRVDEAYDRRSWHGPNLRGSLRGLSARCEENTLAGTRGLPCVLIPGGVTLPAEGGEDLGIIQSIGARFSHGMITREYAARHKVPVRGLAEPRLEE